MDKEENKESIEPSAEENPDLQEMTSESKSLEEDKAKETVEDEQKADQAQKKGFHLRVLAHSVLRRKWLLISILGLVFIFTGLGITIGPKWQNMKEKRNSVISSDKIGKDLLEEGLSPFFIPLPPDASGQVVIIDFSVIWDGMASVRFKKMESQIRDHLYRVIKKFAEREDSIEQKTHFLETEMSRILKTSLGMEDLEIRIKGINYH